MNKSMNAIDIRMPTSFLLQEKRTVNSGQHRKIASPSPGFVNFMGAS
jgi:hypothetical protein